MDDDSGYCRTFLQAWDYSKWCAMVPYPVLYGFTYHPVFFTTFFLQGMEHQTLIVFDKIERKRQILVKMKNVFLFLLILIVSCKDQSSNKIVSNKSKLEKQASNHMNKEEFEKAIPILNSLIFMDSTEPEYYYKRAYSKARTNLNFYGAIGDYKLAYKYKLKDSFDVLLSLAVCYSFIGEFDSSIYYYDRCLRINPNDEIARKQRNEVIQLSRQKPH